MPSAVTVWDDATVLGLISGCRCTGGCFHAGRHTQKKQAQEGFKWANSNTPAIIQHGKGWTAESPIPGMTRLRFKPPCSESWSKWCTVNSRDAKHRGINGRCTVKCPVLIPRSGEAKSLSISWKPFHVPLDWMQNNADHCFPQDLETKAADVCRGWSSPWAFCCPGYGHWPCSRRGNRRPPTGLTFAVNVKSELVNIQFMV